MLGFSCWWNTSMPSGYSCGWRRTVLGLPVAWACSWCSLHVGWACSAQLPRTWKAGGPEMGLLLITWAPPAKCEQGKQTMIRSMYGVWTKCETWSWAGAKWDLRSCVVTMVIAGESLLQHSCIRPLNVNSSARHTPEPLFFKHSFLRSFIVNLSIWLQPKPIKYRFCYHFMAMLVRGELNCGIQGVTVSSAHQDCINVCTCRGSQAFLSWQACMLTFFFNTSLVKPCALRLSSISFTSRGSRSSSSSNLSTILCRPRQQEKGASISLTTHGGVS